MNQGLLHLHNFMRWVVLIMALLTLVRSFSGMNSRTAFGPGMRKTALFLMISVDVQLLIGLALYFMNGWLQRLSAGAEVMKDPVQRFFTVEHTLGMLIGLILIHVGYSASKKDVPDATKFKRLFWYTLIALIVILISIPWPFSELLGRPWFPGMPVSS